MIRGGRHGVRRGSLQHAQMNAIVRGDGALTGWGPHGEGNGDRGPWQRSRRTGAGDASRTEVDDHDLGRRPSARRRPRLRAALPALPPADHRLHLRHGPRPRPRGGRHAGGLRLRAAPHARDRPADRVQAVDLRDRQERVHRRRSAARAAPRRSPTTPTTAWAPPTTARLVSPAPTPDAAVEPKQTLDDLRGAFGGLSEAHHQILVMRELEGLSYREIGERLGMSRPSVESHALPRPPPADRGVRRARHRRALPAHPGDHRQRPAAGALGMRDQRRMARHVSHCQPCRRRRASPGSTPPRSPGAPVRARIAALLPLPAFLRGAALDGHDGGRLRCRDRGHGRSLAQLRPRPRNTPSRPWPAGCKAAAVATAVAVTGWAPASPVHQAGVPAARADVARLAGGAPGLGQRAATLPARRAAGRASAPDRRASLDALAARRAPPRAGIRAAGGSTASRARSPATRPRRPAEDGDDAAAALRQRPTAR